MNLLVEAKTKVQDALTLLREAGGMIDEAGAGYERGNRMGRRLDSLEGRLSVCTTDVAFLHEGLIILIAHMGEAK